MNKPTLFFSHSTKDEAILNKLRKSLLDKLGGTVDVFLSSDGQSIPFGKNWVHRIEEALKESQIMFVFLSPNSINSKWIYFEAGYSYSKGIEVIPIGILRLDLNKISPPLNLLQGFNVQSKEGLNNIISVVNTKFNYTHHETFTDEEFNSIFLSDKTELNYFGKYSEKIDYILFKLIPSIREGSESFGLNPNFSEIIKEYLKSNSIEFGEIRNDIYLHGMKIEIKSEKDKKDISIYVDPFIAGVSFKLIKDILNLIYEKKLTTYFLYIYFDDTVNFLKPEYKVSSRIYGSDIKISERRADLYEYENIMFAIDKEDIGWRRSPKEINMLRIVYKVEELNEIPISDLLNLIFDFGILSIKEGS